MTQATCEVTEPLLQAYRDGELDLEENHQVEGHLADCGACREAHEELGALGERLRSVHKAHEEASVHIELPCAVGRDAAIQAAVAAFAQGKGQTQGQALRRGAATPEPSGIGIAARRIGGYEIESEIARGGMGRVYRALQVSMDRPVALKVLAPHLSKNPKYVARFLREAHVAATISHPNLISVYDVGQEGEQLYYSMELVEGDDLEATLDREGRLPARRVAEIGVGIAQALEAANQASVVHRDIKPANVLVTADGRIKLADLGLAKDIENKDSSLTLSRTVIGSPNYMSPEQGEDLRSATHRSDLYMLGATLLHLVTGELPFGAGSPIEVLARVLRDDPQIPDVIDGEALSPSLKAILARCLEKEPEARYPSATSLLADLQAYLDDAAPATHTARPKSRRVRRSARMRRSGSSEGRMRRSGSSEGRALLDSGTGRTRGAKIPPLFWIAAAALLLGAIALGIVSSAGAGADPGGDAVGAARSPRPDERQGQPSSRGPLVSDGERQPTPEEIVDDAIGSSSEETSRPSPEGHGEDPPAPFDPRQDAPIDAEAEVQLASLERWRDGHPGALGDTYRRARDLAEGFPQTAAAAKAARLAAAAEDHLRRLLDEAADKAEELEGAGRMWEAQQQYAAFLSAFGGDVPGATSATLAERSLGNQIESQIKSDLGKADRLLDAGEAEAAELLLAKLDVYAGADRAARAREDLGLKLATALARARDADGPGDGDDAAPPPAADEPLQGALALLDQGREALRSGDLSAADRALERLRGTYGEDETIRRELRKLERAIAESRRARRPDLEALLTAVLAADVDVLGDRRVRIGYGFASAAEADDWREVSPPPEPRQRRLYDFVQARSLRKTKVRPWTIQKRRLFGYGYGRRRLIATFDPSEGIEVAIEAKGKQNLLVGFHGGGTTVAGFGYMLESVRMAELMGSSFRRKGDGVRRYLERMERVINLSRERGPSLAVFQEQGFLQHEELLAEPLTLKGKTSKFSVELRPADDDTQEVVVKVGKKLRESAGLKKAHRGPVEVSLLTLGAVVLYDKVVITGKLSERFVKHLEEASREAGQGAEPEAIREAFRAAEAKRAKQEGKRKRKR